MTSKNVKTAQFKSYNFKNVDAPDIKQVKFTYDKDNNFENGFKF